MASSSTPLQHGLAALKRLAARPPSVERCGLCGVALGPEHRHLVDPQSRRLECACTACALLFENQTGRYRLVPRDAIWLRDFVLDDLQWDSLGLPIGLAFLFQNSVAGKPVAFYPSPAGATESLLPLETWHEMVSREQRLQRMQPDVEAFLVNRIHSARDYFIAPVDRCYELTGIVRKHWRGFSGGDDLWNRVTAFFDRLRSSSRVERGA